MFGKSLALGIITAILSSIGAILYGNFYNVNLFDYSMVVGPIAIATTCTFVSVFAAVSFWLSNLILKSWGEFVFNLLFCLGSMVSILLPINANIEHEIPDFFPVFAIPMHFFPVLVWMSFKPLFFRNRS